jgi:hypothetical protein
MEIEHLPCIQDLEKFVEKLPENQRAEAYRFIDGFYVIGAGDGALVALAGKTKENVLERYGVYFARKIREHSI